MGSGAGDREGKKSLEGRFAEEVELALELGVSPSRILGREPVERHEHYDADGFPTGYTVVRRDPEFTPADRAALLAWRRKKAELESRSYGIPLSEALDPANQFAFKGPAAPTVDYAEQAFLDAQAGYYKRNPNANKHGHRWGPVTRRE